MKSPDPSSSEPAAEGASPDCPDVASFPLSSEAADEKFRLLFEHSPDAILFIGEEGIIDCNPTALELYGCRKEELLGRHPVDFSPERQPDGRLSREKAREMDALAWERGLHGFEWTLHGQGGMEVPCEVMLRPLMLAGRPTLLSLARDLRERKRAKAAVLRSEARLRGIIGSAMDAIISVDAGHRIVVFNRAAEEMFRCRAEEVLGQRLERLLPERFRGHHSARVEGFGRTG